MSNSAYHSGLLVVSAFVIVQCVVYYMVYIGPQYAGNTDTNVRTPDTNVRTRDTNVRGAIGTTRRRLNGDTVKHSPNYHGEKLFHKERKIEPRINPTINGKKPAPYKDNHSNKKYRIVWFKLRAGYYLTMRNKVNMEQCEYNDCSMEYIQAFQHYDTKVPLAADAVIFQGNQIMTQYPPIRSHPSQVFIFFDMESPPYIHYTRYKSQPWKGVFNWTMTYRHDSDFFNPYGLPVRRDDNNTMPHKYYSAIYKQKTKTAIWIVSHCHAQSKREEYVKKLSEYIDIDVIGLCGEKLQDCKKRNSKNCLPKLLKPYKFYLAFENNLCKDYITEKYYKTLEFDIIPVVRGGGDYNSVAIPGTYIDAADFTSVKDLANNLKQIGSSEENYTAFLKTKHSYVGSTSAYQRSFCEVCKRLRDVNNYRKSYTDIGHWWARNMCKTASDIV